MCVPYTLFSCFTFIDINYYSTPNNNKEKILWRKIYKKYKHILTQIKISFLD